MIKLKEKVNLEWDRELYSTNPQKVDIFCCGDSFTYGGELCEFGRFNEYRRRVRYSHQVFEKSNKTYYNQSKPGASNDWIARSTIDWFKCGNTADIAVIQFTDHARVPYYDELKNLRCIKPRDPQFRKLILPYTDYAGNQEFNKNLLLVDIFLKSIGVKPIYLTINVGLMDTTTFLKQDYYCSYCKDIDVKWIYDEDILNGLSSGDGKNPNYTMPKLSVNPELNGYHPSEQGHSKIADWIINTIKSRGY